MATRKKASVLSHADVESIEEEVMSEYGHQHPLYKFDGNEADRRMTYLALTDPAGATAAQAEHAFQLISEGMEWNVALKKAGVPAVSILRASAAGFMHSAGYSTPRSRRARHNPMVVDGDGIFEEMPYPYARPPAYFDAAKFDVYARDIPDDQLDQAIVDATSALNDAVSRGDKAAAGMYDYQAGTLRFVKNIRAHARRNVLR